MAIVFLSIALLVSTVSTATSLTITATTDAVTVRRGEELHMSCEVGLKSGETVAGIGEVRWYRGSADTSHPSGSIDVSTCSYDSQCITTVNTTDNRGIVHYTIHVNNIGRTTLTIASSALEDDITFYCSVLKVSGGSQTSAPITVTVHYLPNTSYPTCTASSHLLGTTPSSPSSVLCSSEITQPVVSLEWTTLNDSSRISLTNDSVIVGGQVVNTLHLHEVDASLNNSIFTCFMTSEAYPGFHRNCSRGPVTIFPAHVVTFQPTTPDKGTTAATITTTATTESQTIDQGQPERTTFHSPTPRVTVGPTSQAPMTGTFQPITTDKGTTAVTTTTTTTIPTPTTRTTTATTTATTAIATTATTESRTTDHGQLKSTTFDSLTPEVTVGSTSQAALTGTGSQKIPVRPFTATRVTTTNPDFSTHITSISTDQDLGSTGSLDAATPLITDADTSQPSHTHATTPPQSSPQKTTTPLPIVIIASAGAAAAVVILILLIIIACLVASRRTVRKNREDDETSFVFENCEGSAIHPTDRLEFKFDGIPLDDFRPTRPPAPPTGSFIPAPPTDVFALPSECLPPPEYAVVKPRSQRNQPSPEYAVLNPESDEPSPETAHGAYAYPSTNFAGAGGNLGASPPEYAAVAPLSQRQPPTPEYAVLNPDSDEPSPEIPRRAYASPSAKNAGTYATAGVSPAEYASYQPGSKWQLPAPDYAVLDPDSDDGYSYTLADGSRNEDEALAGDEDERWEQDGQDDELQRIGPGFIAASPKLDGQDADRGKEEKPKGEFCLVLPDDTLISEKILGEIESSAKKKKKGKGKPRLDPF